MGATAGGLGGGFGRAGGELGKNLLKECAKDASMQTQKLIRTLLGITTGGVVSSANAVVIKVTENILKQGKITRSIIAEIIFKKDPPLVDKIWEFLIRN